MLPSALDSSMPERVSLAVESTRPREVAAPARARPRIRAASGTDVTLQDWQQSVELLRVAFNGGPNWFEIPVEPRDHLVWKLVDYPGPTRAYFSEDHRMLVGFVATLGRDWLVRGQPRVATDMVDAALHPRVQGRVLVESFRYLRREINAWNGADFSFSFASHPALIRNRGFQGKHDLGQQLETFIKPLDLLRFVRGERTRSGTGESRTRIQIEHERRRRRRPALVRLLAWEGRLVAHRLRRRAPSPDIGEPFAIGAIERFDDRVDGLFERAATEFDLIQARRADFLNWRYADPRAGHFTIRVAEAEGELLGYAVTRTTQATADLADLLVLPGREDVACALLRDSISVAREAGSSAIRSWMTRGHPYEGLLGALGFVRVRTSTRPVLHANPRTDPEELAFLESPGVRVHLMLGDSDHV